MRLLIASDIHGSGLYAEKLLAAFESLRPDKLLLLGDILYHGPRNPLPEGYAPLRVAELLNGMKNEIVCVRGNCDAEVDQMVLEFPMMEDYTTLLFGRRLLFATHGHVYGPENPPAMREDDILLSGHTHIAGVTETDDGYFFVNPGSVSLPKGDLPPSCMWFDDGFVKLIDFDGKQLGRWEV